jgi:hypothetical protein
VTFPAQPSQTRILLGGVTRDETPSGTAPIFSYHRYGTEEPMTTPLDAEALGLAARIRIQFSIRPHGSQDDRLATSLQDDVVLRTSNPNATSPDPTCR